MPEAMEVAMNDTAAKAAVRSPSYPNMPLREAIEAVAKIEKPYRSSPVDRVDAVKLIGYSGLSGPANKALAALAAYGLLERAGKGEARVTERARDILHAESPAQRTARLMEAAMEPALYRELRERFDMPVPPEDGVVTYLNRQGFNPNAVRPAAKAFLQTMSYLQELGATDSHGVSAEPARNSAETHEAESVVTPGIQDKPNNIKVTMDGPRLHVVATNIDAKGADKLIKAIQAYQALLDEEEAAG